MSLSEISAIHGQCLYLAVLFLCRSLFSERTLIAAPLGWGLGRGRTGIPRPLERIEASFFRFRCADSNKSFLTFGRSSRAGRNLVKVQETFEQSPREITARLVTRLCCTRPLSSPRMSLVFDLSEIIAKCNKSSVVTYSMWVEAILFVPV